MKTSDTIEAIFTALNAFQAQMTTMPKPAQGYGYKYTPFDVVMDTIREPLASCGLGVVQMPTTPPIEYYPAVALTTRLVHISGEWLEDTAIMPVPEMKQANSTQAYGAALQYARRYSLVSMLGLAADEDTDAASKPPQAQQAPAPNGARKPSEKQHKALFAMGKQAYGDEWDVKRAQLVAAVTKQRSTSSTDLTFDEMRTILDGISKKLEAQLVEQIEDDEAIF